jgi:hypothetical protein
VHRIIQLFQEEASTGAGTRPDLFQPTRRSHWGY